MTKRMWGRYAVACGVSAMGLACSGGNSGGTSGAGQPTVSCTQKPGADTDKDCVGNSVGPRKLDCSASQTQQAVAAGCTPTKSGDSDVCCPLTVSGVATTASTTATATLADFCQKCASCFSDPTFAEGFCTPFISASKTFDVATCTAKGDITQLKTPTLTPADLSAMTCAQFDAAE